jgi:acetyl-CoA acyltransferase 1
MHTLLASAQLQVARFQRIPQHFEVVLATYLSCVPMQCLHSICRQCSSGLQAIADVAAAIQAGYYTIGIGAGVETMSINPMAWEGGVNPKIETCAAAGNCLLPMGKTWA